MNKRIIKAAYGAVIGVFMLMAVVGTARQGQDTNQQNSNSNQSSGQQNRNANRQSRNTNASSKASDNMNSNNGQSMGGQTTATGQGTMLSSGDRKFAMAAAMGGMAEVELGRVAAERGSSDAVKQFGQRMVDDHSRANSELMQWASGKGLALPTALDAKHQALMTKMSALSGAAFDRAYAKEMVNDHNKDVALFQREASRGSDSDLKAFAQKTLPTLQEHLSMARALPNGNGSMNGNSNRSGR